MPCSRPRRTMSRTGRICPVRLVMCVTSKTFVRGVIAWRNRSTTCDGGRRRNGELDGLDDDALAPRALFPRRDHARVVLRRVDDLVAGLQLDAGDQVLERFGGVARDRHFLGVAAELGGELAAARFDAGLEDHPHLVDGDFVREAQVPDHLLEDVRRRGAAAAVVEVDQRPVHVEGPGDPGPVRFVGGELRGFSSGGRLAGLGQTREGIGPEGGERGGCDRHLPEQGPSIEAHREWPSGGFEPDPIAPPGRGRR